jgi:hypothetical protein
LFWVGRCIRRKKDEEKQPVRRLPHHKSVNRASGQGKAGYYKFTEQGKLSVRKKPDQPYHFSSESERRFRQRLHRIASKLGSDRLQRACLLAGEDSIISRLVRERIAAPFVKELLADFPGTDVVVQGISKFESYPDALEIALEELAGIAFDVIYDLEEGTVEIKETEYRQQPMTMMLALDQDIVYKVLTKHTGKARKVAMRHMARVACGLIDSSTLVEKTAEVAIRCRSNLLESVLNSVCDFEGPDGFIEKVRRYMISPIYEPIYVGGENPTEVEETCKTRLREDPDDEEAMYSLAQLTSDKKKRLEMLETVLKRNPYHLRSLYTKAEALHSLALSSPSDEERREYLRRSLRLLEKMMEIDQENRCYYEPTYRQVLNDCFTGDGQKEGQSKA